jgi:cytochrome c oxidase subunit 2
MRARTRTPAVLLALLVAAGVLVAAGCSGSSDEGATDGGPELTGDARRGRSIVLDVGCTACHTTDGSDGPGPTFTGLYGSEVRLQGGSTVTADEDYLRRAITDPGDEVVEGFDISMPSNALDDDEVDAVVAYLRALSDEGGDRSDDGADG